MRLERYNEYKLNIAAEAKRQRFKMPEQGTHITFYFPVPKSWPKYKKAAKHLMLHDDVPDVDNCGKAIMDSLMAEDKKIADIHLTKKWVNAESGYIEIRLNLPVHNSPDTLV